MKNPERELADLEKRREEIKATMAEKKQRLREVERRRREELNRRIRRAKYRVTAAERKRRTRRLILMGTYAEQRMKEDPEFEAHLLKRLGTFLTRAQDRELFQLPNARGASRPESDL